MMTRAEYGEWESRPRPTTTLRGTGTTLPRVQTRVGEDNRLHANGRVGGQDTIDPSDRKWESHPCPTTTVCGTGTTLPHVQTPVGGEPAPGRRGRLAARERKGRGTGYCRPLHSTQNTHHHPLACERKGQGLSGGQTETGGRCVPASKNVYR